MPHPAQVAGFTTLAYCADFTTDTGINNYAGGAFGTMVWSNTLNWLNCFGTRSGGADPSNPQWQLSSGGVGTVGPCANVAVGNDSVSGVNAMQVTVTAGANDQVMFVQTGSGGCSFGCYESFPAGNMYIEWKARIDKAAYIQRPGCSSGCNNLAWDLFSYYLGASDNGAVEFDSYEVPSGNTNAQPIGPALVDWSGSTTYGDLNSSNNFGGLIDNNYHVIGTLNTSNSSVTKVGSCGYIDGTTGICNAIQPKTSGGYKEQGYAIVWNTSGHQVGGGAASSPVTVTGYLAYLRIWSCAGWSSTGNQPPSSSSTTNTCVSSTVYNSGTPP